MMLETPEEKGNPVAFVRLHARVCVPFLSPQAVRQPLSALLNAVRFVQGTKRQGRRIVGGAGGQATPPKSFSCSASENRRAGI